MELAVVKNGESKIMVDNSLNDSLKRVEALADPFMKEIEKGARDSVSLPSMPREATIKSISRNKTRAKISFWVKGETSEDMDVKILQPNFKTDDMEINLKKGSRVFIAYLDGKLGKPVIVGRLP